MVSLVSLRQKVKRWRTPGAAGVNYLRTWLADAVTQAYRRRQLFVFTDEYYTLYVSHFTFYTRYVSMEGVYLLLFLPAIGSVAEYGRGYCFLCFFSVLLQISRRRRHRRREIVHDGTHRSSAESLPFSGWCRGDLQNPKF